MGKLRPQNHLFKLCLKVGVLTHLQTRHLSLAVGVIRACKFVRWVTYTYLLISISAHTKLPLKKRRYDINPPLYEYDKCKGETIKCSKQVLFNVTNIGHLNNFAIKGFLNKKGNIYVLTSQTLRVMCPCLNNG